MSQINFVCIWFLVLNYDAPFVRKKNYGLHVYTKIFAVKFTTKWCHCQFDKFLIVTYSLVKSYNHCSMFQESCKSYKKLVKYCKCHESFIMIFRIEFVPLAMVDVTIWFTADWYFPDVKVTRNVAISKVWPIIFT